MTTKGTFSLEKEVRNNRDVVIPLQRLFTKRAVRRRKYNGLPFWKSVNNDIEKATYNKSKSKDNEKPHF
jgi:hypothetical protein